MTVQAKVDEGGKLRSLSFLTDHDTILSIDRLGDGFGASELKAEVVRGVEMRTGEIKSSLFGATDAAGIPDNVAIQIADIFAGDIDFHRDLRRGDRFAVVFETLYRAGQTTRPGRVLAAEFSSRRKIYRAVWFQDPWGRGGYYTPERSEEHTSELQSRRELVCRLLLEKKKQQGGGGVKGEGTVKDELRPRGLCQV